MKPFEVLRMKPAVGGGGGSHLDTQAVTAGLVGVLPDRSRGFNSGSFGSCADGTSNLYAGPPNILELYHQENGGVAGNGAIIFKVAGVVANTGWSTMEIVSQVTLNRASATFSTAGGNSSWTWSGYDSNPFGAAGIVRTVNFD